MAQLFAYTVEPRDFLCKSHTSSVNAKEVWYLSFELNANVYNQIHKEEFLVFWHK